jgi:hypothetical protein
MKQTFTYLVAAVLGFLSPSLSSQAQNFNGVFKEVTSQADFTEGYYVIIKPFLASPLDTETALCGVKKTGKKYRGDIEQIKIESNGEIHSPKSNSVWKVEQQQGTFTIKHESTGEYMLVGESNQLNVTTESSQATRLILSEYAKNYTKPKATAYTFRAEEKESWLVYGKHIDPPTFVFTEKGRHGFKDNTAAPRFFKLVVPFTMSAVQYATYYGDKTVKLPAGLMANVGEIDAQKHMLKLTPIGNVVPANTAVIITGAAGEYTLDVTTETAQVSTKNDLKGSMTEIPATTVSSASVAYYAMGYNTDAQKVSFGLVEGTSIPAGKAYIEISKTAGAAPELLGDFLISSVQHVQRDTDSATIYDLNGRKVTQPVSGQLYVRNGKKFIYLR